MPTNISYIIVYFFQDDAKKYLRYFDEDS